MGETSAAAGPGTGRPRRGDTALVAAYLLSRALLAWMAVTLLVHPAAVAGDLAGYEPDAVSLLAGGLPYREVDVEYPPGALPLLVLPALARGWVGYRTAFVVLALVVDAVGFAGLRRLADRWGRGRGPWIWVAGVLLMGPVALLRLDLLPAVATIWAFERVAAGRVTAGGAWLGAGAVAKLYPAVLVLPALAATRRRALLRGAAVAAVVGLAPFAVVLPALASDVLGYHTARGLQVESTWATPLLVAGWRGADVVTAYTFGAHHVEAAAAPLLKTLSSLASLGALAAGVWLTARAARRAHDGAETAVQGAFVTLALLVACASVFSPQYVLWLLALGAAVCCAPAPRLRDPVLLLLPVAVLSQLGYPFLYEGLLRLEPLPIAVVGVRNAMVVVLSVWAAVALGRRPPADGQVADRTSRTPRAGARTAPTLVAGDS